MRPAGTELIADLNDGKVKITDINPTLKAAISRWHDQRSKIPLSLRAPDFLLHEVQESTGWTPPGRLDTAVEIIGQCIAGIESLDDEIACGALMIFAERASMFASSSQK